MGRNIFLICGIICLPILSFAQKQDYNWCFGDSCGISFNDSSETFFVSALSYDSSYLTSLESCASISDSTGNLLFYTSGSLVWNKNHQVMPNGNGLLEENTITQGALILPKPGDATRYYIFHLSYFVPEGFYYSVVNMSLDSGLGDIEVNHKNIMLDNTTGYEKLTAVKHANGRDWWILHRKGGTSKYYTYLLTPDTLLLFNIQNPGGYITNLIDVGELNFSPDGNNLVAVALNGRINLFDFDRCTGTLSNLTDLSDPDHWLFYGSSFSPDGSKLYVSSTTKLFQFDLNAVDILQSKQLIWNNPFGDSSSALIGFNLFQHQLGPNGKIYIVLCGVFPMDTFLDESLCVINKPNEAGIACDFEPNSFYLGGHHTTFGLPNLPNYNLGHLAGSPCDTLFNTVQPVGSSWDGVSILPNPIERNELLEYTLTKDETITITLYDASGKLVQSFITNQTRTAGIHKEHLKINKDLPAGNYVLMLSNGSHHVSVKMVKQ